MSKREEPQISVTLQESHWLAIIDIILQVSQKRGGQWPRWGRYITSVIKNAVRFASERGGVPSNVAGDGGRAEPLCPREVLAVHSEIGGQDRAVVIEREQARAVFHRGRRGTITRDGDRYVFQVQTTAEFKAGKWPLAEDDGYHGWIEIGTDDQIVAGDCDCPDKKEGRAALPNDVTYCEHMGWAKLSRGGACEKTVELYFEQGKLLLITDNGHIREPRLFETARKVRRRLDRRGYHLSRTRLSRAGVTRIYIQGRVDAQAE